MPDRRSLSSLESSITTEGPGEWSVRRLKTLCRLKSGNSITSESIENRGLFPVYGGNGLRGFTSTWNLDGVFPLIGRVGALCGNVHLVHGRVFASEHAVVARPALDVCPGWLAYALRVMNLRQYSQAAAQPVLTVERIAKLSVPTPPLEEQRLIVRYLDHAELRIAKAIAAKTELARLLQQQRLALLCSEVLGRDEGTDVSRDFGRLVESRVLDWVGPVPKSWDVVPMSGVFDVVKRKNIGLVEKTVLSLSYGRVVIKPAEKLRGLVPESFETYQIIEPGDVIVRPTDLQNDTTSLRIGQARDRGIITSAYIALRPKKHVDPDYVMMQLAAYDFLKVLYGFGSGLRQNLDFKHLKHVPMMLPSLVEQSAIVSRVRAKTESVEQAHAAILQEIALLKEYRTRLISDVVTGKMDVRDEAAKLPDIDPMELATVAVGENGDDEEATDDD